MRNPERLESLVAIMDRLRDPGGCPWDREQTYESLRRYLLEECYEVVDALDRRDAAALREELGDLLFQIVFLSRLAKEDGEFTIQEVIRSIADKLVRRHPHVFGSASAETPEEVERNWERIKREEKGNVSADGGSSLLDGIPAVLPGTLKAQRLGERAAAVGFDWQSPREIFQQIDSELGELRAAVAGDDPAAVREEIGDVLFTVVMLARKLGADAEGALQATNLKFRDRFQWMEQELTRRRTPIDQAGFDLLEQLWTRSKAARD